MDAAATAPPAEVMPAVPEGEPAARHSEAEEGAASAAEQLSQEQAAAAGDAREAPSLAACREMSGTLSTASSGVPLLLGHAGEPLTSAPQVDMMSPSACHAVFCCQPFLSFNPCITTFTGCRRDTCAPC